MTFVIFPKIIISESFFVSNIFVSEGMGNLERWGVQIWWLNMSYSIHMFNHWAGWRSVLLDELQVQQKVQGFNAWWIEGILREIERGTEQGPAEASEEEEEEEAVSKQELQL